jgi:DNA-binding IclR family transcriptional regulator
MLKERQPIAKAMTVLRWLAASSRQSIGVRELAHEISVPVASVHRALTVLAEEGLVEQDGSLGKYRLTWEAYRLGAILASRAPIKDLCLPHLREAAQAAGETVSLSIVDMSRLQTLTIARVEIEHPISIVDRNQWQPLYAGSRGMAVLAFLEARQITEVLRRRPLERITERTIVDPAALERDLLRTRKQGFAFTRGQRIPGAVGLAAPVFQNSKVFGSVHVSIPEQRFLRGAEARLSTVLRSCGEALSRELAV